MLKLCGVAIVRVLGLALLLIGLTGLNAGSAMAVPVNPGDTVPLGGTTLAESPNRAGSLLNTLTRAFEILDGGGGLVMRGSLVYDVIRSDSLGTLVFEARLFDLEGPGRISALRVEGFDSFSTDIDYRTDAPGNRGPFQANRSSSGANLTFAWLDFRPPDSSLPFSVLTNATNFTPDGFIRVFSYLDDVQHSVRIKKVRVPTGPTSAPEPLAGLLVGGALAGLAFVRRPSRQAR